MIFSPDSLYSIPCLARNDREIGIIDSFDLESRRIRVRFQGTTWPAYCLSDVTNMIPGESVYIVSRQKGTLILEFQRLKNI